MNNPILAEHFYDIICNITKGDDVILEELCLIKKFINKGDKLLDIGCGTGRHLKHLTNEYRVTGIDNNKEHLKMLRDKIPDKNIKIINDDIYKYKFEDKYNLIILFWNTINEICFDIDSLEKLLNKLINLLEESGTIIINIDNTDLINIKRLDFVFNINDNNEYGLDKYEFKVIKYDNINKITKSKEIFYSNNKVLAESIIIQKWWRVEEIKIITDKNKYNLIIDRIKYNKELYLIISKNIINE